MTYGTKEERTNRFNRKKKKEKEIKFKKDIREREYQRGFRNV